MPPTVSCLPGTFPLPFLSDSIPTETVHCPHKFMAWDHPPFECLGPNPMPQLWGAQSKRKGVKISQTFYPPPTPDVRNGSSPLKPRDSAKESGCLKLSPIGQKVGLPGAPGILLSLLLPKCLSWGHGHLWEHPSEIQPSSSQLLMSSPVLTNSQG